MIPKIIHQIWIGEKLPPQDYLDSWKITGFEYILWNEENLNKLEMTNRDKYDYYYDKKIYYGCADIARVEILSQYGGLYIDADTLRLKDLPSEWFNYDFFAVKAYDDPQWDIRITNGIIGASINNSIIRDYKEKIQTATKIMPCWSTIGGTALTKVIKEKYINDPMVLILEPWTFYPKWKHTVHPRASEAYATHIWGSKTKKLYKSKDTS